MPRAAIPLKIGDYPQAKQVSEVDVLGLLRIARGLNSGADLAGNAIGAPTRFAIACAANPAAADLEVEFSKLRAKIEAGATFAQTQPVYDLDALARFLERPEARAIPILVGLIPLLSLKQTLFFANEVPGIVVPPADPGPHAPGRRARRRSTSGRKGSRSPGSSRPASPASPAASTSCRWASTRRPARSSRRFRAPSGSPARPPERRPGIPGLPGPFSRADRTSIESGPSARPSRGPAQRRDMKTTMMRLTAGLGALLAAGHLYAGAQCRATGSVTDSTGAALADVTVNITTPQLTSFNLDVKTDAKGNYATILHDCTMPYHLKFEKEGYVPFDLDKKIPVGEIASINAKLMSKTEAQAKAVAQAAPQMSANDKAVMAFNAGVEAMQAGDKATAETKFQDAVKQNPDLPAGWQALAQTGLREEGLGQGDRVRPEGHGPRPVAHQPLPDDGRRGDEDRATRRPRPSSRRR